MQYDPLAQYMTTLDDAVEGFVIYEMTIIG